MTDKSLQYRSGLHFDRTLTLSVIVALALQTGGALIWAGATAERLDQVERRLDQHDASSGPASERLARLEAHAVHARVSLERIERRLDEHRDSRRDPD